MRLAFTPLSRISILFAGIAFVGLPGTGALAHAAEAQKALPGVEGGYSIVKPREEVLQPEPDTPPSQDGVLKVGDWDVRISGSVIVDIGTMKPRSNR
ncbi:hypothetical protein SAMN04488498_102526 [Mesorhizobium albiziae]|uniref:Uncharacterized protein n=1 Tax=Neomesorhizobium albiziae TaxID=335020 RepID=A0A1I3WVJ5_9HYPH|nr:hypothetical protein [Mesorhizobium albiziae]GLS31919.1 hypothetical protein GCM10007937_36290 [Mesorhizobium albiziae]SFK11522.1 hypothetical protein SAMN04488498_102526 [Mesorhizobium albiziae]